MNQKKLKYMDAFKHESIIGNRNEIKDIFYKFYQELISIIVCIQI
jgi:hypothetical protein